MRLRPITACALALFALVSVSTTARAAGALDGKSFTGEVGEKGKSQGDPDTLVFQDGKFRSTACDKYGFGDAPYTTKVDKAVTTVEARTTNAKGETMEWTLSLFGDQMRGKALYTVPGKEPITYWVKVKRKR
jgi:hypothetical protein